jgi:hypothetical protein
LTDRSRFLSCGGTWLRSQKMPMGLAKYAQHRSTHAVSVELRPGIIPDHPILAHGASHHHHRQTTPDCPDPLG